MVKTTTGTLTPASFTGYETGVSCCGLLQTLTLDASIEGAIITAKPGPLGGNGFVDVGFIDETCVELGALTLAGTVGGDFIGTTDKIKDLGATSTRDRAGVCSTIGSILFKGQALGPGASGLESDFFLREIAGWVRAC